MGLDSIDEFIKAFAGEHVVGASMTHILKPSPDRLEFFG